MLIEILLFLDVIIEKLVIGVNYVARLIGEEVWKHC